MKKESGFLIGNACILVATIFWGLNVPITKVLIPEWMTGNGISAVRIIGGCILFWTASLFMQCRSIDRSDWLRIILGGTLGLFGFIFLFVNSLKFGNPIDISIIMTLPPMFVILIGIIFMHERPSWIEYVGVVISFAGAAVVIADGQSGKAGSDNMLSDFMAVASTLCYAFYLVILQKPTAKYKPVNLLRWVFLFAAIPGLLLLPGMQHEPIVRATEAIPWLEIGFILLCPTFIAYFLVQPAIKNIGSELVSLYQYMLPVFATIASVAMGIDHLRPMQVVAMVIIIGGMVLTNIGKKHRKSVQPDKKSAA